jgi:hypothetical protein
LHRIAGIIAQVVGAREKVDHSATIYKSTLLVLEHLFTPINYARICTFAFRNSLYYQTLNSGSKKIFQRDDPDYTVCEINLTNTEMLDFCASQWTRKNTTGRRTKFKLASTVRSLGTTRIACAQADQTVITRQFSQFRFDPFKETTDFAAA